MPEHSIRLKPLMVPSHVFVVDGVPRPRGAEIPKFALSDLSEDTLAELCDDFRRAVFGKAGKADPKEQSEP